MSAQTKTERVLRDVLNSDNLRDFLGGDVVSNAMKWRFLQAALYVLDGHGLLGDPDVKPEYADDAVRQEVEFREYLAKVTGIDAPAPPLPTQDGDDNVREAAPLDPSKVKAGDTVTLEKGAAVVTDVVIEAKSRGVGQFVFYMAENPDPLIPGTYYLVNHGAWTLTDHQPAPEPEPEYQAGHVYSAVRLVNEALDGAS